MRPEPSRCGCAFSSVGRPCVAHRVCPRPYDARERLAVDRVLEVDELPRAAPHFDLAVLNDRDAGRIVAAVFEPAKTVKKDRHDRLRSNVADDSTHYILCLCVFALRDPAGFVLLPGARNRQGARWYVRCYRGASCNVRAIRQGDRGHECAVAPDEDPRTDDGLVFLLAVVVARNRAGADVGFRADYRVAKIRKVIGFCRLPDARLLQLDEVADMRIAPDLRPGPDVRERSQEGARFDCGIGHHSVVAHTHAIADGRVDDARTGVDLARGADLCRAFEKDTWIDHRVGADDDVGVDVGGGGIDQRHAGGHEFFVLLLADHGADLCKFSAAVDPANFVGTPDRPGGDRPFLFAIDRDEIGQVVLALFVGGADRIECGKERRQIERVDAGVDFVDRLLRRRGVAFLDDLRDLAVGADDSAVAEGPREIGGDDGCSRAGLAMRVEQRFQGRHRELRNVAREQHERAGLALEVRPRLQQRVTGPELLLLRDELQLTPFGERSSYLLGPVAHDNRDAGGM